MDLDAIRTAALRRAGLTSSDALGGNTDVTELVNEALHAISTETMWPWLEDTRTWQTAAGTQGYNTGTRWVETRSLRINEYQPLIYESRRQLQDWYLDDTNTGLPQYYTISGDEILLYPTPDGVYDVDEVFFTYEAQLSGNTDTPAMPVWAHPAIVEWTAALFLERIREEERAAVRMARAQDWLKRMRDNVRRTSAPAGVRVRPGSLI